MYDARDKSAMKCVKAALLVLCALVGSTAVRSVYSYDVATHSYLSLAATRASMLDTSPEKRARIGLERALDDERQKFIDSKGNRSNVLELIRQGARYEDDGLRALNHFYDPITGSALYLNPARYAFRVPASVLAAIVAANATNRTSPDWALDSDVNVYSRRQLATLMYDAYTSATPQQRSRATGAMFETIGRIVHHVQDMAQPQHVRNDAHLEGLEEQCPSPPPSVEINPLCPAYPALRAPSSYEAWTASLSDAALPVAGYAPVYDDADRATFTQPRQFWSHLGKGLAEFTNLNFYSAGTLERTPPNTGAPFDMLARDLCQGNSPPCGAIDLNHKVRFFPSNVQDSLRPGTGGPNPYAKAESIYNHDFTQLVGGAPVTTVNRFTFQYAHAYLLPRAVGYSAGLINYIFRGEMQIRPPAQGVYAIVDTTPAGCGSVCGFRNLRLRLQNTTPNGEVMGPGTLTAVVKFRRNGCFDPNLAGHFGGPAFLGNECRLGEEIAVSGPLTIAQPVPRDAPGGEYAFQFSTGFPVPIAATDVQLQVVFRGRLGQEDDAFAVTTLDIAEPNFFAVGNNTDYYWHFERQEWLPKTNPYSFSYMRVWFADPAVDPVPIAAIEPLNAAQHAQFAFLGDKTGVRFWLRDEVAGGGVSYADIENVDFPVQEFVLDETVTPSWYRTNCPVQLIRGMYRQFGLMFSTEQKRALAMAGEGIGEESREITTKLAPMTCVAFAAPGEGGFMDLSRLVPQLTPASASRWVINF